MNRQDEISVRALAGILDGDNARVRAEALLKDSGSARALLQAMARRGYRSPRVTRSEARRLRCALSLVTAALKPARGVQLLSPTEVARTCPELAFKPHEEVWVVSVDTQLRLLRTQRVAVGTPNRSLVAPRDVLRAAFRAAAAGLFVLHNHPGGSPVPSAEDIHFTETLRRLTDALGLTLHDHLVVAGDQWTSCVSRATGRWFPRAATPGDDATCDGSRA